MNPNRSPRRPKSVRLAVESLECRTAPATLVNPTTVSYTDVDGDNVIVKTTKGTFDLASEFFFVDTDPGPAVREQLQSISFAAAEFEGASLTVTAVRSPANGGDGFANVGQIIANQRHLGAVTVDGDLGLIIVGNSAPGTVALQSLTVQSIGRFGTSTQPPGGSLFSSFSGNLGSLLIKDDVVGATLQALGADTRIGRVQIGGSLHGTAEGGIFSGGSIDSVRIGGDLRGGSGTASGSILAARLGPLTIGGSLIGGSAANSGLIRASTGDIGLVKIGGSLLGGDGNTSGSIQTNVGKIAGVTVTGSLVGGSGTDGASIYATGDLGPVKVGGDLRGNPLTRNAVIHSDNAVTSVAVGGSLNGGGVSSAVISGSVVGSVSIGGSVRGGNGQDSASVLATEKLGPVRIGGDLLGSAGIRAGSVFTFGQLLGLAVGGSVIGGAGSHVGGQIHAGGDMGPVTIGGDLRGVGADTANILGDASIASVTIGGSIIGGATNSGRIARTASPGPGSVGPIRVEGSVFAGTGTNSGNIAVTNVNVPAVTIGGSLVGGFDFSGMVQVAGITVGNLGLVKIGGDMVGGSGTNSGSVLANNIGALTVVGNLRGGGGSLSGNILSQGSLGAVRIGGDVIGGTTSSSGRIGANDGPIASVAIGGSLIGGFFDFTGEIFTQGNLGPVKISGDIRGGSAFGLSSLNQSGYIQGKNIASIAVGGSVLAGQWDGPPGTLTKSGSIRADERLGAVTVKGSLVGNSGSPVIITARGLTTAGGALAIQSLTIGGRVEFAQILAGYNSELAGANGNAQIGAVVVGRDWIASSVAAGVLPANGMFGDADDFPMFTANDGIVSRIARINIKGAALGALGGSDHFGFVAQQIGSLSVGGTAYPLQLGPGNDTAGLAVGATGDLRVREV